MRFAAAPEYQVFPTEGRALKPYEAAVRASAETRRLIREVDPEVVVADILTVAATLAAELEDRPWATLVPHVLPMGEPGFPVYAVGAVYPRTAVRGTPLAHDAPAAHARRGAGARASSTRQGPGSGWPRWPTSTAGPRAGWRWWRPSPSSSIRAGSPSRGCG